MHMFFMNLCAIGTTSMLSFPGENQAGFTPLDVAVVLRIIPFCSHGENTNLQTQNQHSPDA